MDDHANDRPTARRSDIADPQLRRGISLVTARGNLLLDQLADDDLALLLDRASESVLALATVLYEPGQHVAEVHFPISGVISLVADLGDGAQVEAATIGLEGMSGLAVFLGACAPTERATVQVAGRSIMVDVAAFECAAAAIDGPLFTTMQRYAQVLFTQLARNAACNRVHTVEQRAARWLLTTADRMRSPTFELTQEFLAQMLAVRRASVSTVARGLAESGCIHYSRGRITVLDRARLLSHACDCYQVLREITGRAFGGGTAVAP